MPIDGSIPASGKLFQAPDLQRIQANQLALDEARARAKDRADQAKAIEAQRLVMDEIAKIPLVEDPETGILRPDRNAITQRFGGVMPKAVNDWLDDDDKHLSSVLSAQEAALKRGMTHVAASGFSPAAWKRQVELWGAGRVLQKDEAAEWGEIQDPEQIKQIVGTFSGQKPGEGSYTLGPNDTRFGPDNKQVAAGQVKAPEPPKGGTFEDYLLKAFPQGATPEQLLKARRDFEGAGRAPVQGGGSSAVSPGDKALAATVIKNPGLYDQLTPTKKGDIAVALADGGFDFTANMGSGKAPTGVQRQTLSFFNRANNAADELEKLEPAVQKMGVIDRGRLAYTPDWANFTQSQTGQSYTAAQRAFTEARLRKDSGAAIPEQEFANDRRTYFVQPGDTAETIALKKKGRAAILASLAYGAGPALSEFYGDDAKDLMAKYKAEMGGKPLGGGVKDGDEREVPGHPGVIAVYRGGKWIVK